MTLRSISIGRGALKERITQGNDARWMLARPVNQMRSINEEHLHRPPHLTVLGWRVRGPGDRRSERGREG